MPWDAGTMDADLADALRRVAALRGSLHVARFYVNARELHDRLQQAEGNGEPLTKDEAEPIIHQHYHELVELEGKDHAQQFVRLWLMISRFLERVEKGRIARTALKRQIGRVSRR